MQDTIPFLTTIITKAEADEMNPLVLAFVGDSVQQLYVRTRLALSSDKKSGALHQLATKEIKAEAQADIDRKSVAFSVISQTPPGHKDICNPMDHSYD